MDSGGSTAGLGTPGLRPPSLPSRRGSHTSNFDVNRDQHHCLHGRESAQCSIGPCAAPPLPVPGPTA